MSPLFLCVLLACICGSFQRSTPEDSSYVAAVVEFERTNDFAQNLNNYVQLIQDAAAQDADVVVFPEMTLMNRTQTAKVPIHGLLQEYSVPALRPDLYDESLVRLSEAARQYAIYVVVNIRESMNCADAPGEYCPQEIEYHFNTNVVFDRTGAVIDRYRKINLFGELTHTPALTPDLGIFSTDFGVTFGHFICFDLMFQVPSVQVVQKPNLTDIIFTTMWFSEMPFLTAVEIQEAYAYAMNVNFLASGANNVAAGSAGSGIFSGKAGALVSIMPGLPTTRLLVARVPKVPGQVTGTYPGPIYDNPADHDSLVLISDPSFPAHVSRQLVNGFQEFVLVDKDVSCKFTVRLNLGEGELEPRYRAFIHDGSNTYARREVGVIGCAVVACKTDDVHSCVYRIKQTETDTEIQELEIKMTTYRHHYNSTLKCDDIVYFPASLRSNKFPLDPKNFSFVEHQNDGGLQNGGRLQNGGILDDNIVDEVKDKSGREQITYKINLPQNNLIAFGIWGRVYNKDVDHNTHATDEDYRKYNDILDIIYGVEDSNKI